ncbi:MAG: UDP-2,3-diacylglucosamine diphosphatase [Gemmatimonadota bacterium]|jgi:UDP-2,3-diacylglucosamine hydrolase|nr:UDP-2,3-diacylglucosamine hydrolase [Gemmatimonadota bacterium]MDP6529495.1 UDP-2,3-diacylglucosamine diphosphatase [Gemmatimonadota bacterium]MDP6802577.1 UDP-2,3-diacylglucosamine diphosphatase [Gemmatimonadota bacterium]MDP7030702.1 UDP-2,3-diacylglucosamine diphosphatase [Gemmatimonadota bacterium]
MARPVFFVSDAHLGSSEGPDADRLREERLFDFLRRAGDLQAEAVYILGDLFDFWFEYRHVMPVRYFGVLREIRHLTDRGVPVHFVGGNHDWWVGRTFREAAGMSILRDPVRVEHQGFRLYLSHGDGIAPHGDAGYAFLKRVLRNRVVIGLLRCVHPDLAYSLGAHLSRVSRTHFTGREFRIDAPLAEFVDGALASGHDAFLMGHLHVRHTETRPGGRLFVLGDWMSLFSALRLEDGEFTWEDWRSGAPRADADPWSTRTGGHTDADPAG